MPSLWSQLKTMWGQPATFDPRWGSLLERGVWQYRHLPPPMRERLHVVTAHLVARTNWTGGSGFRVTAEMKVVVSGAAALLAVGHDPPFNFPRLKTVILYPSAYEEPEPNTGVGIFGEPITNIGPRYGEAWRGGPVVLSWRSAQRQARAPGRGRNLVLHELAHHLDGIDGDADGAPYFADSQDRRRWRAVADEEYHRLVGQSQRGELTLLDPYGATNPAEFFAVATECFFERPHPLNEQHAALYRLLATFYGQDPTDWLPRSDRQTRGGAGKPNARDTAERNQDQRSRWRRNAERTDFASVGLHGADADFARGVMMLDAEEYAEAARLFTKVIDTVVKDPNANEPNANDPEAYQHRALARLRLGDHHAALKDAEQAIAGDPYDVAALLVAAEANMALGGDQQASRQIRQAIGEDRESGWAHRLDGRLQLRAGNSKRALQSFRKAIGRNPFDAESHYWLAECLEDRGQTVHAERRRQRAFDLDPGLRSNAPAA